jgi:hypothetical protein
VRAAQLPAGLKNLPAVTQPKVGPPDPNEAPNRSDNSNSQLAMLALWVAQNHDLPMERTFNLVDQRFRQSQAPDGSWVYAPGYLLWSVERVAVLYHLDTIGGKDWYSWGAKALVATQKEDGSWSFNNVYTAQSPIIDTCFALLFLRKANFVPTLTRDLRQYIRVRDAAEK